MKAVLASHNKHKIAELQALIGKYIPNFEIMSLSDAGVDGEIIEDGDSFEANALIKARFAARSGHIGIGDDSGLCVDALGGAPGIYSARYAGEDGNDSANNKKLLSELKGKARDAKFVCVIACVFPDGRELTVRGEAPGKIIDEYRGGAGFGYDPLFEYETGKTFAEMTADEKNKVSHRARAIEKFAKALTERLAQ